MDAARGLPDQIRQWIGERRESWLHRPGVIGLIPVSPPKTDYPCNGSNALLFAQRQTLQVHWPHGTIQASEDDVIVVPTDRPHRCDYNTRKRRYPALFIWAVDEDLVVQRRNLPKERLHTGTWRFAAGLGRTWDQALSYLIALQESDSLPSELRRKAGNELVAQLFSLLGQAIQAPLRRTRGGPAVAVRCRNLLAQRLQDPDLDLPQIAEALNYNVRRLGREFVAATGQSVRDCLIFMRVQRARELLRRRELPIADVARQAGFASASHFSRTFHRIEGNTPREFRRYGHLEEDTRAHSE